MTVADKIAKWLADKEIDHAFGIIGAGNIALWNAIEALGKTQIICVHHEQAAAMAGSAYYAVRRRIALVLVTTGAGSTNAITGVVSAWMDSTPVLIISGNEDDKYMYAPTRTWGVQGYDSRKMVEEVTKFPAHRIRNKAVMQKKVITMLEDARTAALTPRQGPAWVDIPKDVQNADL